MRILFIYPDDGFTGRNRFHRGIAQLSACLKKAGFEVGLLHISNESIPADQFLESVTHAKADMLAYSSITTQYPAIRRFSELTKRLNIFTVYGGIHPTICPEVVHTDGIDAVCRGEGDEAFVEFAAAFRDGKDITSVRNFWVKKNGRVYENPLRPLLVDLDELPFPDFDLFHYEKLDEYVYLKSAFVMCSRGCPFNCSYCCNHQLRQLYPNRKDYLRWRSVEKVIREIESLRSKYPNVRKVRFGDDTLAHDKEWFRELMCEYKKRVNLPFSTNDRVTNISEETVALYKDAGCVRIDMGIESGNDHIRNDIFRRYLGKEKIIDAFHLLRKHGIQSTAFNIIGSPEETMSTILETAKLNAVCRPTTCINSYLFPFPGSKMRSICDEQKLQVREFPKSQVESPVIALKTISQSQLIFGYNYFRILTRIYRLLFRLSGKCGDATTSLFDRIICSSYFPYRFFNVIYINKAAVYFDRFPRLVGIAKKTYRKYKSLFNKT